MHLQYPMTWLSKFFRGSVINSQHAVSFYAQGFCQHSCKLPTLQYNMYANDQVRASRDDFATVIQLLHSDVQQLQLNMSCVDSEHSRCEQVALAIACSNSLVALELRECSALLALAIALALKDNGILERLAIEMVGLINDSDFALPDALKINESLRVFELRITSNQFDDAVGCSFADALHSNCTLQAFKLDTRDNTVSDTTGLAMAQMLRRNVTLTNFDWDARGTRTGMETQHVLASAFRDNVTLLHFTLRYGHNLLEDGTTFKAQTLCTRNRDILLCWRSLATLAYADDHGLSPLVSYIFRSAVLAFWLPSTCNVLPRWFSRTGWISYK